MLLARCPLATSYRPQAVPLQRDQSHPRVRSGAALARVQPSADVPAPHLAARSPHEGVRWISGGNIRERPPQKQTANGAPRSRQPHLHGGSRLLVMELHHESTRHVHEVMAMEQPVAGIVGNELDVVL